MAVTNSQYSPPICFLRNTGEAWWTIPFLEWWRIPKTGWLIILTQLSVILFFTGWVYQEAQYNSYFQAYLNSVLPLVTAVLIVALAITAAPTISILRRRIRRTQQARQTTMRPKTVKRTQPPTSPHPQVSKHAPKPTDKPRHPAAAAVKPARVMPTVAIPRFILEPQKPDARENPAGTSLTQKSRQASAPRDRQNLSIPKPPYSILEYEA